MDNTDRELKKMRSLIDTLNKAAKAYYVDGQEIMSNYEYDALYDELEELENKTGIHMSDSPLNQVGYEVLSELPKERHASPMLSLSKTKNPEELKDFLGDNKGLLSWKMDGLTIVLTYEAGDLVKAVTRGNGEIGEIVTNNARVFKNIPLKVSHKGKMVIRGEAVIHYSDFEKVNADIPETSAKYKNPRNLCSGSVRQLDNSITKKRNVRFYAFELVEAEGLDSKNSRSFQFEFLKAQGLTVVEYKEVDKKNIIDSVKEFEAKVPINDFPSDGLVLLLDDIEYGTSLGRTSKFPRNAIAFKWKDETAATILRDVEWSASRTGLINPVAIFDGVELEGTKVSRASLHNISYIRSLKLGIGDSIQVFKANMIIPQIAENETGSDNVAVPDVCPVCGARTRINDENGVKTLYCTNEHCPAKHIKSFVHLSSRDALNIEGFSEATIDRFIQHHFIRSLADIYKIDHYKDEIIAMVGFGEKSYVKLISAIERSRKTKLFHLVYGMGIPGIGLANAKMITRVFKTPEACIKADEDDLVKIEGVGPVLAGEFVRFFKDENKLREFNDLVEVLEIEDDGENPESLLEGKIFVITGSLNNYDNRSDLKELIESLGGKVTGSVTSKTSYLINNDINSTSEKNKKARALGVSIISEEDFENLVK